MFGHEKVTLTAVAEKIAELNEIAFLGDYQWRIRGAIELTMPRTVPCRPEGM